MTNPLRSGSTRPAHLHTSIITLFLLVVLNTSHADDPPHLTARPQPWQRHDKPVLSARNNPQPWRAVVCYSPHVIYDEGKFRMWYLGTSEASRSNDIAMGYAESDDGLDWTEHPDNPVLSGDNVPWGNIIQTPFVLRDPDEDLLKMWFVSGDGVEKDDDNQITRNHQQLGYATSTDGVEWKVHPQPIYPCGRSPSVIRESATRYRMWMGSRPDPTDTVSRELYSNIYEFTSEDGLDWTRSKRPVLRPIEPARSTVYPFVLKLGRTYHMWHGCHVEGGRFEIFCATSNDGSKWTVDHNQPAFPAAADRSRFDARYTSTPCIVHRPRRLLLYYSARDWNNEYTDPQGRTRRDGSGVYAEIGVAEMAIAD